MKITARNTSALAIALAIPATSIAGAALASAQEAAGKEVSVNVNFGSDAADTDVTLKAGGKTVGNETTDDSGKVSFSYNSEGADTLEVEVDGETVTLSDAKCEAVKEIAGADGNAAAGANTATDANGTATDANGTATGADNTATGADNTASSASGIVDNIRNRVSELAPNLPSIGNLPTDGSAEGVEPQSAVEDALIVLDETTRANHDVDLDIKDAKEISNDLKKIAKDGEKASGAVNTDVVEKAAKSIDKAVKDAEKKNKDNVTLSAHEQSLITDALESVDVGALVTGAVAATPAAPLAPLAGSLANNIKDKIIESIESNGDSSGSLIDRIKDRISGDDDSDNTAGDNTAGDNNTDGTGAADQGDAPAPAPADPETETVDLTADVNETSFTVDLEDGTVSVDCDVDATAAEVDEDEDTADEDASATPSQSAESAAPAAAPSAATPGPKVNTGGAVEGSSFFAKVKAALF